VNPATNRPPRIWPRASMRRSTGNKSRQGGAPDSLESRSRNNTPHLASNCSAHFSTRCSAPASRVTRAQRPAACRGLV
jgi:hypothetical protein